MQTLLSHCTHCCCYCVVAAVNLGACATCCFYHLEVTSAAVPFEEPTKGSLGKKATQAPEQSKTKKFTVEESAHHHIEDNSVRSQRSRKVDTLGSHSLLLLPLGGDKPALRLRSIEQRCGVNITTVVVNVGLVRVDLYTHMYPPTHNLLGKSSVTCCCDDLQASCFTALPLQCNNRCHFSDT